MDSLKCILVKKILYKICIYIKILSLPLSLSHFYSFSQLSGAGGLIPLKRINIHPCYLLLLLPMAIITNNNQYKYLKFTAIMLLVLLV